MATSLAHDAKHEDWAEPRVMHDGEPLLTRARLLWTLLSLALLGAFLLLVIDDYPLRNLIAVQ